MPQSVENLGNGTFRYSSAADAKNPTVQRLVAIFGSVVAQPASPCEIVIKKDGNGISRISADFMTPTPLLAPPVTDHQFDWKKKSALEEQLCAAFGLPPELLEPLSASDPAVTMVIALQHDHPENVVGISVTAYGPGIDLDEYCQILPKNRARQDRITELRAKRAGEAPEGP